MKQTAKVLMIIWTIWAGYCIFIALSNPYKTIHWGFGFVIISAILWWRSSVIEKRKIDAEFQEYVNQNIQPVSNVNIPFETEISANAPIINRAVLNEDNSESITTPTMNKEYNNVDAKVYSFKKRNVAFWAVIIVLALVSFTYNYSDISKFFEKRKEEKALTELTERVKTLKEYPFIKMPNNKLYGVFKTRWADGFMYYQFAIVNNGDVNKSFFTEESSKLKQIDVEFLDKYGFKLFNFTIQMSEMAQLAETGGYTEGKSVNTKIFVPIDTYKNFESCSLLTTDNPTKKQPY